MSLDNTQIETKLIKKLLTSFSVNDLNIVRIQENDILGIYIYGSRVWGTDNVNSDLDYVVILDNKSQVFNYYDEGYFQKESEDIDLHIMSATYYEDLVRNCDEFALSIYFQKYPLMKYEINIKVQDLNLQNLRKSFSSKANNSYVKAKKKLQDGELKTAYKSLYHSIRILDFGRKIAEEIIEKEDRIYDMTSFGECIEWFEECFIIKKMTWEEIHKIFKPIFNDYATEFKKLAPKN